MDFSKLPRGFRRNETCIRCHSITNLTEVFVDGDSVITRFTCPKCGDVFGLVYTGPLVDAYKKTEANEHAGINKGDIKSAEDMVV